MGSARDNHFFTFFDIWTFLGYPRGPTFHIKSTPVGVGARLEIYEKSMILWSDGVMIDNGCPFGHIDFYRGVGIPTRPVF